MNAARGSPHPRREDRTRLPKCRGLLTDDADIQRRRQRPPPHAGDDDAAVDSSSAANKNYIRGKVEKERRNGAGPAAEDEPQDRDENQ